MDTMKKLANRITTNVSKPLATTVAGSSFAAPVITPGPSGHCLYHNCSAQTVKIDDCYEKSESSSDDSAFIMGAPFDK
jgi:hypothetical protein